MSLVELKKKVQELSGSPSGVNLPFESGYCLAIKEVLQQIEELEKEYVLEEDPAFVKGTEAGYNAARFEIGANPNNPLWSGRSEAEIRERIRIKKDWDLNSDVEDLEWVLSPSEKKEDFEFTGISLVKNPPDKEARILSVSSAPKEKCDHEPSSRYPKAYTIGPQYFKCRKCGEKVSVEEVSREEKPKSVWEDEKALRNIYGDRTVDAMKSNKGGINPEDYEDDDEEEFTLSEVADLMEKIEEGKWGWLPLKLVFGTKDIAVEKIDWPRLFRERPELVEKIRSEAKKND